MVTTSRKRKAETWMVEDLRPEDWPRFMMIVAEQAVEEDQRNGEMLTFDVLTDGTGGKPPSSVRRGGKLNLVDTSVVSFQNALTDTRDLIAELSPYSPKGERDQATDEGWRHRHYRDSHLIYVNGDREIDFNAVQDINPDPDDEVWFINIQPYARRLERGWSGQAPHGIYKSVARRVKRTYLRHVQIAYTERSESLVGAGFRGARYPVLLFTSRAGTKKILRGRFYSRTDPKYRGWF